jgi:hypothetical protein
MPQERQSWLGRRERKRGPLWPWCLAGMAVWGVAAGAEFTMGRKLWGISGEPGVWSGDINSSHNSQYLFDPYTFTHITHGILLYGLSWILARRAPLRERALMTLSLEALWEIVENMNFVINRYRAETISLHYYGDSVINSMSDIETAMAGFAIAAILPARFSLLTVLVLETTLALTIRDSLLLNIVMLVHPIAAVRRWQAGV